MKTKKVNFDLKSQDFSYNKEIINEIKQPLSLTVQITRRCNLYCEWCSEAKRIPDANLAELKFLADQIKGVGRVYISGGEPLVRKDFLDIIKYYSKKFPVVALLTNAVLVDVKTAKFLKGKIKYAKVGLDGPRDINNLTRGKYDEAVNGINNLIKAGIDVSISAMLLKSNLPYLDELVQVADLLGISQVKLIEPVRRGAVLNLPKMIHHQKKI